MILARNTIFILIGGLIDLLQAGISAGIAVIAAFPGTAGGAGAGLACAAASNNALVSFGCWAGGGVLALLGTTLNPVIAPMTVPIGMALGLAVNITLSIVLGWAFLVPLMFLSGTNVSWKRLALGGGEMIPGLNNIPFWTFFVIASLWQGATTKKARRGILGLAAATLQPVRGAMSLKEGAVATLQHAKEQGAKEHWLTGRTHPVEVPEPETIQQPTSARELIRTSERQTFQDVRPLKPHAKTA